MYDNDIFGLYSYQDFKQEAEIVIRGEEYIGFENIETGFRFTEPVRINPQPRRGGDSASCRPEPIEKVFNIPFSWTGAYSFYRLLKKGE